MKVLVTRQLPEGGLEPLAAAGHEIVQRADDTPFTPAELAPPSAVSTGWCASSPIASTPRSSQPVRRA